MSNPITEPYELQLRMKLYEAYRLNDKIVLIANAIIAVGSIYNNWNLPIILASIAVTSVVISIFIEIKQYMNLLPERDWSKYDKKLGKLTTTLNAISMIATSFTVTIFVTLGIITNALNA